MTFSDYDSHRFVSFIHDPMTELEGFIAIHRGNLEIPALGATRLVKYQSHEDALKDALSLSKLMSYKAAVAGLKYGGAKGVIMINRERDPQARKKLLEAYAEKVNYLNGHFVTGSDVGINQEDVLMMHEVSPFFVGVFSKPERMTAEGVYYAMQVAAKEFFGTDDLQNRSIAVQGLGKIGYEVILRLYGKVGRIVAADIDSTRVEIVKNEFPEIKIVDPKEIHRAEVDIYCPCALGNCLNHQTIEELNCKTIIGGANNQLENPEAGQTLHDKGILYAPDYVVNAGGLIGVVDEYENKSFDKERIKHRVLNIGATLKKIIEESKRSSKPTNYIADEMAEKIFNNHD